MSAEGGVVCGLVESDDFVVDFLEVRSSVAKDSDPHSGDLSVGPEMVLLA